MKPNASVICIFWISLLNICIFLATSAHASEATNLQTVFSEGKAFCGENTTPAESKALAINDARRKALEKATGVDVRGSSVVYNNILINDLISVATKGLIVREKIDSVEYEISNNGEITCSVKIEAEVQPLKAKGNRMLKISKADIFRIGAQTAMSDPVFQNGEEIQVKATLSGDGYLHLFNIDQKGNVTQLFPNDYVKNKKISKKQIFIFPSDDFRTLGIKLKVSNQKSQRRTIESIFVFATETERDLLPQEIEFPTLSDLMRNVSQIDHSLWDSKTIGYTVVQ